MSLYPALPPVSGIGITSGRVFSLGWREGRCPPHPVPGTDMLPSQNLDGCHASFPRPLTIPVLIGKWKKRLHFVIELISYLDRRFARRFTGGNGSSVYHRRAPAGRRPLRLRAAGAGGLGSSPLYQRLQHGIYPTSYPSGLLSGCSCRNGGAATCPG